MACEGARLGGRTPHGGATAGKPGARICQEGQPTPPGGPAHAGQSAHAAPHTLAPAPAAPLHTVSCSPSTGRRPPTASIAATKCISDVPETCGSGWGWCWNEQGNLADRSVPIHRRTWVGETDLHTRGHRGAQQALGARRRSGGGGGGRRLWCGGGHWRGRWLVARQNAGCGARRGACREARSQEAGRSRAHRGPGQAAPWCSRQGMPLVGGSAIMQEEGGCQHRQLSLHASAASSLPTPAKQQAVPHIACAPQHQRQPLPPAPAAADSSQPPSPGQLPRRAAPRPDKRAGLAPRAAAAQREPRPHPPTRAQLPPPPPLKTVPRPADALPCCQPSSTQQPWASTTRGTGRKEVRRGSCAGRSVACVRCWVLGARRYGGTRPQAHAPSPAALPSPTKHRPCSLDARGEEQQPHVQHRSSAATSCRGCPRRLPPPASPL